MRCWPWMMSALLAMTAFGCRGGGSQQLLEREHRLLEDKIYELEDHLEQCHEQNEKFREENESLRSQLGSGGGPAEPYAPPDVELPNMELPDLQSPDVPGRESREPPPAIPLESPSPSSDSSSPPSALSPGGTAPPFEGPPVIQPPGDGVPEGELPPLGGHEPTFELVPPGGVDTAQADTPVSPPASTPTSVPTATQAPVEVAEISVRRYLAGGQTEPGARGSEGLVLVVEPRDASGQYVNVPGTVAAVVLDPTKKGAAARVARWDFTPDDGAVRWRESALGRGMHFHLEWPNGRPDARMLNLYVRYITADGHELRAEQPVDMEHGEVAEQWLASTRPLLKPAAVATRPVVVAPQPAPSIAAPSPSPGENAQGAVRPLTAGLWRGATTRRQPAPSAADPAAILPREEPPQTARRPSKEDPASGPWSPYR